MQEKKVDTWFEEWFNTPYYHMLYGYRDDKEAEAFLHGLMQYLPLDAGAKILDLACGKGRHAKYLASLNFMVWGVDIAEESIAAAKLAECEQLHFEVHDMRNVYKKAYFDAVFSLFTSFGYFETKAEDVQVLQGIKEDLKAGGLFILDFFNAAKVKPMLPHHATKQVDDYFFETHKMEKGGRVVKEITVTHEGKVKHFKEQVYLYEEAELREMLLSVGLEVLEVFGNYQLGSRDASSDRCILYGRKPA